ncbi:MAG: hypothetical protein JNM44_07615 [Chitinophagaceae bacterium]|nr:hypothetical protein [Chitinophagaceae bacterium]
MMNKLNVFTFLIIVYSVVVCMTVKHTDELQVVANHIQKDTIHLDATKRNTVTEIAHVQPITLFSVAK